MLFFPSHDSEETELRPWTVEGKVIGFCREIEKPAAIWLMTHGNGGQANQRGYILKRMSERDSLYVLEYPGYGSRDGVPSRASIDAALGDAYNVLRKRYPGVPLCALGESMGSGPASFLATMPAPPEKIVLIVPFDSLASVAAAQIPFFPVRMLIRDDWNNIDSLKAYKGRVEIFAANDDEIIPYSRAKNLAAHVPGAKFFTMPGGHGWSNTRFPVRIER